MKTTIDETLRKKLIIERLAVNDRIESFDCGDADLNDFILNEATFFQKEKLSVSYLLKSRTDIKNTIAFFSLANDKISITDFENKTRYNRFSKRFGNTKRLKSYPAVKIGRIGVSQNMKGKNIGTFIMNYIKTYFILDNKTGCRFLTVDAYADVVPFYLKNGFIHLNDDDIKDKTRLLYFDLDDVDNDDMPAIV